MSLVDALLLEPYFPLDYHLAAREDGYGGSGTLNDPWNTLFNLTPAGAAVLSVSIDDPQLRNSFDLGQEVEDSFLMALLRS